MQQSLTSVSVSGSSLLFPCVNAMTPSSCRVQSTPSTLATPPFPFPLDSLHHVATLLHRTILLLSGRLGRSLSTAKSSVFPTTTRTRVGASDHHFCRSSAVRHFTSDSTFTGYPELPLFLLSDSLSR